MTELQLLSPKQVFFISRREQSKHLKPGILNIILTKKLDE